MILCLESRPKITLELLSVDGLLLDPSGIIDLNRLPKILELIQQENNTKMTYLRLLGLGYFFKIVFNRLATLGNFEYKFSDSMESLL